MFLILPKTLLNFFGWPKFDEGCWNYHMIPIHSKAVFILSSGAKKRQNRLRLYTPAWPSQTILPFWPLFCHWFGYYFALVWKINSTSLTC